MKVELHLSKLLSRAIYVCTLVLLALFALTSLSMVYAQEQQAQIAPGQADAQIEAKVMHLSHTLRCLVCQNQSIAESNAPLAIDLRNQVREQLQDGRNEQEITDYMVARYGDFVLYRPPMKATTLLLWFGPALLLLVGLGALALKLRQRGAHKNLQLNAHERKQARNLLQRHALASSNPDSDSYTESQS